MSTEQLPSSDVDRGLDLFAAILRTRGLELMTVQPAFDRFAVYIEFGREGKKTDYMLSNEFLADLPATREHEVVTRQYVEQVSRRFQNFDPHDLYLRIDFSINAEITWPVQFDARNGKSYVVVTVKELSSAERWTKCAVELHWSNSALLKENPFLLEPHVMNAVRIALDTGELKLVEKREHLTEYPFVSPWNPESTSRVDLEEFISGKVYWLAFKRAANRQAVWVSDPWDAEYLGCKAIELSQTAQVLRAKKIIEVDKEAEFATAADKLLLDYATAGKSGPVNILLLGNFADDFSRFLAKELQSQFVNVNHGYRDLRTSQALTLAELFQTSDIVIAEVSNPSSNLLFELGFILGSKKPLVLLADIDSAEILPFNLSRAPVLRYKSDLRAELVPLLKERIEMLKERR